MDAFIKQTAKDYGLSYKTVAYVYTLYWPNNFYKKLEEIVQLEQSTN